MNRALLWNAWARIPGNAGRWYRIEEPLEIGVPVHIQDRIAKRCTCPVTFMQGMVAEKHPTRGLAFIIFGGRIAIEVEDVGEGLVHIVRFLPQMDPSQCQVHVRTGMDTSEGQPFEPPKPWTPDSDRDGDVGA